MKLRLTEDQVRDLFNKVKSQDPLRVTDEDFYRLEPLLQKMIKYFSEKDSTNIKPDDSFSKFEPIKLPKPAIHITKPQSNVTSQKSDKLMHPLGGKGKITSHFGFRKTSVGSKNHKGVDIAIPSGSPVYAPADGFVLESKDTTPNGCGGFIKLDHDNIQTKFCHLKRLVVKKGQRVKRGQIIAYSGGGKNDPMRGTATGSHLHYEILNKENIAMNPLTVQSNLAENVKSSSKRKAR